MGVDIQTYRARIGTYSHSQGNDVKTIPNISGDLKTVGCVIFISILLIIAGIELNPGPKEKGTTRNITCAKSSCIKISRLKGNFNKELLQSFFGKYQENGGGKMKHIKLDSKNQSAVIEFEDNTAVKRILDNKPLMINGIEVEVDDLVDAENDSASENIDLAEEVVGDETLDIQFDYNGGHTNQPAAVDEASVNGNESVQFGHSEDDQQFGSDCEHTGTLCADK